MGGNPTQAKGRLAMQLVLWLVFEPTTLVLPGSSAINWQEKIGLRVETLWQR